MKRISKLLLTLCTLLCIACAILPSAGAYEYYDTNQYDVDVTVHENNSFTVVETIKVHFNSARHGIYRYIPYKGTVTREINGKTVNQKYRAQISNIQVDGYTFETDTENSNVVIQIGDENRLVDGDQTYTIRYTMSLPDDKNDEFDDIYLNLLPTGWGTSIPKSTMTIRMPKEFEQNRILFISGQYGDTDTGVVRWNVNGDVITATLLEELPTGSGVTLKMGLPEGYFIGERTDLLYQLGMYAAIAAAALIGGLFYLLFGRDERYFKTVEFYPPPGMTSAEVGYIVNGAADKEDIVSLIIYWANQGCLRIEEDPAGNMQLERIKDLPPTAKPYELTLFNGLFAKSSRLDLDKKDQAIFNSFQASKSQLNDMFRLPGNEVFTKSSRVVRWIGLVLMLVPMAALLLLGSYVRILDDIIYMPIISLAVMLLGQVWMVITADNWHHMAKGTRTGSIIGAGIIAGIGLVGGTLFGFFKLMMPLATILALGATVLLTIVTVFMRKRTKRGNEWLGKLLGLKEFIEYAEADRIKLLVDENPAYFYHILPYAYVLGVSDKWSKKFESIAVPPPAWYSGGQYDPYHFSAFYFMGAFHRCMNSVQNTVAIPPPKEGGNGNFSGGSFSGGGGFSGGGFGGGGGGSW